MMRCEWCDKAMTGRKRRFCDGKCRTDRFCASRRGVAKRTCSGCGAPCYGALCRPCRTTVKTKNWCSCEWCGETFKKPNRGGAAGTYCGRPHSYAAASFKSRLKALHRRLEKSLAGVIREQSKPAPIPRKCCECGSTGVRKRFRMCQSCSQRRAAEVRKRVRRTGKATRRARKRAVAYETVRPHEVFARDAYRCGLCGKRCSSTATVPHPRAPTLDHIIPLSKGGEHTMRNVQCACFKCNVTKSDTPQGQMRLFG